MSLAPSMPTLTFHELSPFSRSSCAQGVFFMNSSRSHIAAALTVAACLVAGPVSAEDLEEIVGQHMVAEALLTAHLVFLLQGRTPNPAPLPGPANVGHLGLPRAAPTRAA
jgi:hypothetical protein